ncbi:hypothetical protein [Maritimibacter alexandrii]|uniref:hypothetical protein n=1 Tax=Maritimibacter alexandrii TaxID=2570355 RepID=UPI001109871B|nr:hypothetical protein [Maritimibacter alexandrii]
MHKIDCRSLTVMAHGLLATLSGATPAKGNIVDVSDAGAATLFLQTGTVTDAGGAAGFSFEVQESDTDADADFTPVADADLVGTEAALSVTDDDDDNKALGSIGYIGTKKHVRVVATGTTGTDAIVSGTWVLQNLRYSPGGTAAAEIAAT